MIKVLKTLFDIRIGGNNWDLHSGTLEICIGRELIRVNIIYILWSDPIPKERELEFNMKGLIKIYRIYDKLKWHGY